MTAAPGHGGLQRAGGVAALYVTVAYLAAIPYFVVVVDYPGVVDPAQKVALLRDHHTSMYLMHLFSFEFAALGLVVVTLAVHQRLGRSVPALSQLAMVAGIIRCGLLLASVMVFNYGMDTAVRLYATAPAQAVSFWQVTESVAEALGGSGGEILGGLWILLLSIAALRADEFPTVLNWLGLTVGTAGVLSTVPVLSSLEVVFGLLQIGWLGWLGSVLLRRRNVASIA